MPILEHDGVFTMQVPDEWTATYHEGTYELTPPGDDGVLHISMYERDPAPLSDDEARDLVSIFLDSVDPDGDIDIRVLAERADQHRAVARCSSTDPDSGDRHDWVVFGIVWPHTVLMCSATAAVGSDLPARAELMFAAIAPAARRRRPFGRR